MRYELEQAFALAARATGQLSLLLVRGRASPAAVHEIAVLLERAAEAMQRAVEKSGTR